jgi:hypothetical protein
MNDNNKDGLSASRAARGAGGEFTGQAAEAAVLRSRSTK